MGILSVKPQPQDLLQKLTHRTMKKEYPVAVAKGKGKPAMAVKAPAKGAAKMSKGK